MQQTSGDFQAPLLPVGPPLHYGGPQKLKQFVPETYYSLSVGRGLPVSKLLNLKVVFTPTPINDREAYVRLEVL